MRSAKKTLSLLLVVAGLSFFVLPVPSAFAASNAPLLHQALPVRLQIPSIKIDAAIQYVGLTGSGSMEVPQGRADVAWYKFGPRPGDLGSAVIAGHRGRPHAPRTVFDNLSKLHKGDLVYVRESDGRVISFVVRETRIYGANERAFELDHLRWDLELRNGRFRQADSGIHRPPILIRGPLDQPFAESHHQHTSSSSKGVLRPALELARRHWISIGPSSTKDSWYFGYTQNTKNSATETPLGSGVNYRV
jgi:LPXTG-site transpeptidase (sortase) family protein